MATWYADVAPAIPLPATGPQVYTYRVPPGVEASSLVYTQVTIALGQRHVQGVVIRAHQQRVPYPTKELTPGTTWQLTAHQVAFGRWLHETMRGSIGYTLRLFFPSGKTEATKDIEPAVINRVRTARKPVAIIQHHQAARYARVATLIKKTLAAGNQTLIVVPERWLVAPLAKLLHQHFPDAVVSLDAEATPKQIANAWQRTQTQPRLVIVGTQKSLFLPFQSLDLIVVEEEFYGTHKLWDQYPRLDNRLAAQVLARIHRAQLVYATSFPSLTLHYLISQRHVRALTKAPLTPQTTVMTPTYEDRQSRRLLPQQLVESMKGWLASKKRVVILHNVLGSWRVVLCRSCHTTVRCPDCQMAMAVHGTGKKAQLQCHQCDKTLPIPKACPACKKETLTTFGAGTERIGEVLSQLFPRTPVQVVEASSDPLPKPSARSEIIVGTTALFTRLPHQSADRVIYLYPERGLLYPDFRSEERALVTLVRLAQLGQPGQPITLVTHKKPLVTSRLTAAPLVRLKKMVVERQRLGYPPAQDMVLLSWQSKTAALARRKAATIRQRLEERDATITIRGPFASFQKMRRGKHEQHLLLLGPLDQLKALYASEPVDLVDVLPERVL